MFSMASAVSLIVRSHHVLIDESLDMELPEYDPLSGRVKAEETDVLVSFTLGVFLLRRICASVADLDEARTEHSLIFALNRPLPGLALGGPGPTADERCERSQGITGRRRLPHRRGNEWVEGRAQRHHEDGTCGSEAHGLLWVALRHKTDNCSEQHAWQHDFESVVCLADCGQ
jgi:hypothetical protein